MRNLIYNLQLATYSNFLRKINPSLEVWQNFFRLKCDIFLITVTNYQELWSCVFRMKDHQKKPALVYWEKQLPAHQLEMLLAANASIKISCLPGWSGKSIQSRGWKGLKDTFFSPTWEKYIFPASIRIFIISQPCEIYWFRFPLHCFICWLTTPPARIMESCRLWCPAA